MGEMIPILKTRNDNHVPVSQVEKLIQDAKAYAGPNVGAAATKKEEKKSKKKKK